MRVGQNVTHRPDGRWEARYIKGRTPEKKAIYGFCYGKTQEEAIQKCEDAKQLLKNSAIEAPKLFHDVYAMWSNSENIEDKMKLADKFLIPALGDTPVTQLTDKNLAQVLQDVKAKGSSADTRKCFNLLNGALNYAVREDFLLTSPIGSETLKYQSGRKTKVFKAHFPISEKEYFSVEQAKVLEQALLRGLNGKHPGVCIGLYLCLHLGLSQAEVGALQLKDVDFHERTLMVNKVTSKRLKASDGARVFETVSIEERVLPLPQFVYEFLLSIQERYPTPDSFIVYNKNGAQCQAAEYAHELKRICTEYQLSSKPELKMLRDTFIVRCIRKGVDLFTVSDFVGIQNTADLQLRFGEFIQPKPRQICKFDTYSSDFDAQRTAKRMNLLIFGTGSEGHAAKEIAENMGVFNEIAFLDDDVNNTDAMNVFSSYEQYLERFPVAVIALGDNRLRAKLTDEIEQAGFIIPVLIDPSATVSRGAVLHAPCIVESKSIINTGCRIGRGALIASGSILDRDSELGEFVHIAAGMTIPKGAKVESFTDLSDSHSYVNKNIVSGEQANQL